jgi:hypothetical protein
MAILCPPLKVACIPHVLGLLVKMRSMKNNMKTRVKKAMKKIHLLLHLSSCFHLSLYLAFSFLVSRGQGGEVS